MTMDVTTYTSINLELIYKIDNVEYDNNKIITLKLLKMKFEYKINNIIPNINVF